jgi:putative membrane protein
MQSVILAILGFALLVTVFALQNAAPVPIRVFFWYFKASMALIIIVSTLVGALLSSLFGLVRRKQQLNAEEEITKEDSDAANCSEQQVEPNGGVTGDKTDLAD